MKKQLCDFLRCTVEIYQNITSVLCLCKFFSNEALSHTFKILSTWFLHVFKVFILTISHVFKNFILLILHVFKILGRTKKWYNPCYGNYTIFLRYFLITLHKMEGLFLLSYYSFAVFLYPQPHTRIPSPQSVKSWASCFSSLHLLQYHIW